MHPLIAELHQDHINLNRLMGVLERQLQLFQAGEPPDYFLLLDLVEYVESYPDLIHHPREDILFKVYLERNQDGREIIQQLMDEHMVLREHCQVLRNLLEQTLQDSVSPRVTLEECLLRYIDLQRSHLNAEENRVFALIDDGLCAQDWEQVLAEIPVSTDPLFGGEVQKRYRGIFEQIMMMS